jgi:hypothetical protein
MPEILGTLKPPRLSAAPSSPALGQMYYDTTLNTLYWWNGTTWLASGGAAEVNISAAGPSPRVGELLWVDTDEVSGAVAPPQLVTALPSSPYDGQEVYYVADATNGVIWHLRYRVAASGSYKWEFIGGSPLRGFYATAENFPSAWGSGNPAVTVPLAGDYDVEWLGDVNAAGVAQFYTAFYLDAVVNNSIVAAVVGTANPQEISYAARSRVTITAGQIVRQGFIQTGVTGTAKNRTLIIRPVRVG